MPQQNKSKILWSEWEMQLQSQALNTWFPVDGAVWGSSALRGITGNRHWHFKATCHAHIVLYFTLLDKDVSSQVPVPLPLLLQQGLFCSLAVEPKINSSLSCLWSWDFSTGTEKQRIHTSTADCRNSHLQQDFTRIPTLITSPIPCKSGQKHDQPGYDQEKE